MRVDPPPNVYDLTRHEIFDIPNNPEKILFVNSNVQKAVDDTKEKEIQQKLKDNQAVEYDFFMDGKDKINKIRKLRAKLLNLPSIPN